MSSFETLLIVLIAVNVARIVADMLLAVRVGQTLERLAELLPVTLLQDDVQVTSDGKVKVQVYRRPDEPFGDGQADFFDEPSASEFKKNEDEQKPSHGIVETLSKLFRR